MDQHGLSKSLEKPFFIDDLLRPVDIQTTSGIPAAVEI
jgi:hypothetical protein